MAVTKTKVIDIDTSGAVKNVDQLTKSFVPLRQQIKQLRDQLAQLEVGSEEFNKISKELADLQQKNIEITEAARYSLTRCLCLLLICSFWRPGNFQYVIFAAFSACTRPLSSTTPVTITKARKWLT